MKKSNPVENQMDRSIFYEFQKRHPDVYRLIPKKEFCRVYRSGILERLLTVGLILRINPINNTRKIFIETKQDNKDEVYKLETICEPSEFRIIQSKEFSCKGEKIISQLMIYDKWVQDWIYVETNNDEFPDEKIIETERGDLDQKKLVIPPETKEAPVFDPQPETTPQPEKVTSAGGNELINCQTEVTVVSPGVIKDDIDITRYFEQSDPFYLATVTFINSISNPNTQRAYKVSLNEFFSLFDRIHPRDILVSHLELYKKYLAEKNQPATVVVKLSALSKYFQYLAQPQGSSVPPLIAYNPMEAVKFPKVEMYDRSKKITIEQARSVLAQIDTAEPAGARDYCIIYWMMLTGRRINEILMLRKKDLYTTGSKIYYNFAVEKSTGHDNEELPQPVWDALRFYWQQSSRSINDNSPLFVGHSNNNVTEEPISDSAIRQKLDFYCITAGISPREVSPHSFRHLHAQLLENSGVSVREIQKRLHHKNLNTTQVYLDKIVDKDNDYWKQIDMQINA